jgi:hypothetical protein
VKRIGKHTGVNIQDIFDKVFNDWEIEPQKIMAVVIDNGSNILKAFKELVMEIGDEGNINVDEEEEENVPQLDVGSSVVGDDINSDFIDGEIEEFETKEEEQSLIYPAINRISCFTHTLQLVVHKINKNVTIKKTLSSVHKVVQKVNASTVATSKLIEYSNLKLVGSCPTRWSSMYLVVEQLLCVKEHLIRVLDELKWDSIQASEWLIIQGLSDLLFPFAKITELASSETYPTIGGVRIYYLYIDFHLQNIIDGKYEVTSVPCIIDAAKMLRSELNHRFNFMDDPNDPKFNSIYLIASFLTPASKRSVETDKLTLVKKEIIQNCTDINNVESVSGGSNEGNSPDKEQYHGIEPPPAKRARESLLQFEDFLSQFSAPDEDFERSSTHKRLMLSLNTYMEEKNEVERNAFKFWVSKLHESLHSKIAAYALDVLTIPASSAPVERIFSTAGGSTLEKRNRLQEKNFEMEVLLRRNSTYYGLD